MNAEILPEEIIFDILSRLPVVSLCRFRCVSKSWQFLISNPHFIKTHLNRSNSNNNKYERLILSDYHRNFYSVELESSQFGPQSLAVHLSFPLDQNSGYWEICCSCDGLVLMLDESLFDCWLVNPSTRQSTKLPVSPFAIDPLFNDYELGFESIIYYGLGYDSSIDDYKVVNICYYDREAHSGCAENMVSVYDLKTNSWRRIENFPYGVARHSGAFVCGALHWAASNGTHNVIAALGLTDENFWTVPSPTPNCIGGRLCVLGGCLSLFYKDTFCVHVWVMKEYGVGDSWTKFTVSNCYVHWRPLSLSRTGQVLFDIQGDELVLFDPLEKESKELVVHGRPAHFQAEIYMESLVSPKRLCKSPSG